MRLTRPLSLLLLAILNQSACALALSFADEFSTSLHTLTPRSPPSGKDVAPYILPLSSSKQSPRSHKFLRFNGLATEGVFQQPITAINLGRTWNTAVTWGTQPLHLVFDTGSSDTWAAASNLSCLDFAGNAVPTSECNFGGFYRPSSTFKPIKDKQFHIRYGDGEWANGVFGFENISLAGLQASSQVAVVERAYWIGDRISSGLIGFGLPALTTSFSPNGSISSYTPVFSNLCARNKIDPVFSVALGRTKKSSEETGVLALGGLPDVPTIGPWVTLPLEYWAINRPDIPKNEYTFYSVPVSDVGVGYAAGGRNRSIKRTPLADFRWAFDDGFVAPKDESITSQLERRDPAAVMTAIIDTGTTLNYFPKPVSDFVGTNVCSTPAVFSPSYGVYLIDCNTTCRPLAVRMGDRIFTIDPGDILLRQGPLCYLGVTTAGAVNILGGTFLKNVVVVFDQGAAEVRFAQRKPY